MSVTIRAGGLIRDPDIPLHVCELPSKPDRYKPRTKISCNQCGQWWKLKFDGDAWGCGYYWKKMRRKDFRGSAGDREIRGPGLTVDR